MRKFKAAERMSRKEAYWDSILKLKIRTLFRMIRFEIKDHGKIGYVKNGIMIPEDWVKEEERNGMRR